MDLFFRNPLIIAKGQHIRHIVPKWEEDIFSISKDYRRITECMCDILLAELFIILGCTSLEFCHARIPSDDDCHFFSDFLGLCEIENMPRMENIKCTETHHMVK